MLRMSKAAQGTYNLQMPDGPQRIDLHGEGTVCVGILKAKC